MKKIKYTLLLLLAVFTVESYGDIIIVSYAPKKICLKIENLHDYPDMAIIGVGAYSTFPMSSKVDMVDSCSCVDIAVVNPAAFLAVKKKYLEKTGIDKIDWKKDKNVAKADIKLNTNMFKFRTPTVESVEIYYKIVGFDKKSMVLQPTSLIIKYNNGDPDSVKIIDSKDDFSKLRKTF